MKKYIFYGLLFLLTLNSCDQTEPNDPCENATPFKAEIEILETIGDTLFAADTVLTGRMIYANAKNEYNSYEWKIGDDPRVFTERSLKIRFSRKEDMGRTVSIRLIANGNPNKECCPEDDGIDTVYKNIFVAEYWAPAFLGNFKGINIDEPNDTMVVNIYLHEYFEDYLTNKAIILNNINAGCENPYNGKYPTIKIDHGYKNFVFDAEGWVGSKCSSPKGYAVLSNDHSDIKIVYSTLDHPNQRTFIGRRI